MHEQVAQRKINSNAKQQPIWARRRKDVFEKKLRSLIQGSNTFIREIELMPFQNIAGLLRLIGESRAPRVLRLQNRR